MITIGRKSLDEHTRQEIIQILSNANLLTAGIMNKFLRMEGLQFLYNKPEEDKILFHDTVMFRRAILGKTTQDIEGYSVPLFQYDGKRHVRIAEPKKYLEKCGLANLKAAKNAYRFNPEISEKIQSIIDTLL